MQVFLGQPAGRRAPQAIMGASVRGYAALCCAVGRHRQRHSVAAPLLVLLLQPLLEPGYLLLLVLADAPLCTPSAAASADLPCPAHTTPVNDSQIYHRPSD